MKNLVVLPLLIGFLLFIFPQEESKAQCNPNNTVLYTSNGESLKEVYEASSALKTSFSFSSFEICVKQLNGGKVSMSRGKSLKLPRVFSDALNELGYLKKSTTVRNSPDVNRISEPIPPPSPTSPDVHTLSLEEKMERVDKMEKGEKMIDRVISAPDRKIEEILSSQFGPRKRRNEINLLSYTPVGAISTILLVATFLCLIFYLLREDTPPPSSVTTDKDEEQLGKWRKEAEKRAEKFNTPRPVVASSPSSPQESIVEEQKRDRNGHLIVSTPDILYWTSREEAPPDAVHILRPAGYEPAEDRWLPRGPNSSPLRPTVILSKGSYCVEVEVGGVSSVIWAHNEKLAALYGYSLPRCTHVLESTPPPRKIPPIKWDD